LAKIFEKGRESEKNKSKHLPLAFVKETAVKSASQSPAEKSRQDMEEIYLQTFRINLLKDRKQIIDEFMHVLHEDTLCVRLATELIESDLMKDWEMDCLYQRVAIWQIIFWVVIGFSSLASELFFEYVGYWGTIGSEGFATSCVAYYENALIDHPTWKHPMTLGNADLLFLVYLVVHVIDLAFYMATHRSLDMWQVMDPMARHTWSSMATVDNSRVTSAIVK
jgi:hypothetical protein